LSTALRNLSRSVYSSKEHEPITGEVDAHGMLDRKRWQVHRVHSAATENTSKAEIRALNRIHRLFGHG